jgi:putative addiction module killer protein
METSQRTLEFYKQTDGTMPCLDWLNNLKDDKAGTVIAARLARLAAGHFGDCKSIKDSELLELRVHVGPGYRLYLAQDGKTIILLLYGGSKRTQDGDIRKAKQYWSDYQRRKNDERSDRKL